MLNHLKQWLGQAPSAITVTLLPDAIDYKVQAQQTLLQAAIEAGVSIRHKCKVGSCGTCCYRLVEGRVKTLQDVSYTLNQDELAQGAILLCQTIAISNVVIEPFF